MGYEDNSTHSVSSRFLSSSSIKAHTSRPGDKTLSHSRGHSFPSLLHLMQKNFAVKLQLYKNMQQKELGNSAIQNQLNEGFFFSSSSNVKQFQEK